jgi:hypothetical protein
MLSELFSKLAISSDTNLLVFCLFIPKRVISKSISNSFELEILSQDLTHVFTLTNKNKQRTELNNNKIDY